jgi:AraC family transcriptional regulator of adaptative response/methylated-DNA-[protein]-cysteine methyltransferase
MIINEREIIEEYYNAVKDRNSQYIGTFFFGVKTTGIFCIPSCRARTPKIENIEFNTDSKELIDKGYRPCKICNPTKHAYEPPKEILKAIDMVNNDPFEKITDHNLRESGLSPENIRRWFKKHHGMTFQAYQRMLRINSAYQNLKKGNQVTDSAFNSGYNSLSGFNYTFKNILGSTPQSGKDKNVVLISRTTTPLGPMFICSTDKGICLLEFTDRKMLETEFKDLQQKFGAVILTGENSHIKLAKKQLEEYFNGVRKDFSVPLDLYGTSFNKDFWDRLKQIPYGDTISYQQLSKEMGKNGNIKSIKQSNGQNSVAIIIPCHRVVNEDGELKGYGGGLHRKQWLLNHEKTN